MRYLFISLAVTGLLIAGMAGRVLSSEQSPQAKADGPANPQKSFRAGASVVDISPKSFPVLVNGGFLQNQASKLNDPIRARSLVLDDGMTRLAIVVVDSCMMPRELIDRAKAARAGENGDS